MQAGTIGAALLALGGAGAMLAGRDPVRDRADVLRGVIPALLEGALPPDGPARAAAIERSLGWTVAAIERLPSHLQKEIGQLFTLLAIPPARIALAGVSKPWAEASVADVSSFLTAWRHHRIALMRTGYLALHDLVLGPWYADASNWPAIGYDGPPTL